MATVSRRSTSRNNVSSSSSSKTSQHTSSKNVSSQSKSTLSPQIIADKIIAAINKYYEVDLIKREERIAKKVMYALREKLGKNIQGLLTNGSQKNFDWNTWNNKMFPKLFGTPDDPKFSVKIMAEVAAIIYDTIPQDISQAIATLIDINTKSLEMRNKRMSSEEMELDDIEDELSELDEEDEFELDEIEDEDLELDDEFELDDED